MIERMNKQAEEKHFKDKLSAELKEVITNFILSFMLIGAIFAPGNVFQIKCFQLMFLNRKSV